MIHNTSDTAVRHKSSLADHADLKEVLPIFIARLPVHVKRLRDLVAAEDRSALMMLAHQLRGAGKSYGFEGITTHAGAVEDHLAAGKSVADGKALVAKLIHYIEHVEGFGDR